MDDLDELLHPTCDEPQAVRRDEIFRRTAGVLRRRRWLRRGRNGMALAMCFVAGALAMRLLTPPPKEQRDFAETPALKKEVEPIDPFRNDSPKRLEQWAGLKNGEERTALLRRAGDSYLTRGDELAALRCYRQALDATPTELAVNEQDSWLMMSLKIARQKEKTDARN